MVRTDATKPKPLAVGTIVDRSGLLGGIVAVCGIGAGLVLDGGSLRQVLQPTAALIVLGGTAGAVLVQFPTRTAMRALGMLRSMIIAEADRGPVLLEQLCGYAAKARRLGLLSLDSELDTVQDPFLRVCLTQAVDGVRVPELRDAMEARMLAERDEDETMPAVFEAAGGFAPTMGILGAVIGLIQVMQRLANIEEVGKGIAVAFVATLYGVGVANLLFLPCAGRLRAMMDRRQVLREMILEGVIAILEKNTARSLERRLTGYLPGKPLEAKGAAVAS